MGQGCGRHETQHGRAAVPSKDGHMPERLVSEPLVSVVIAARNAAGTIARAVSSALRQPEVAEVVVVDDASTDRTAKVADAAHDGSGRLVVVRLEANRGPAGARNLAIDRSSAPFIAILDADDFYLPFRFRNLFAGDDWDIAADNIMFVSEETSVSPPRDVPPSDPARRRLGLEEFIEGNISRGGMHRGELGFLKPVVSRRFLDSQGLRYDENLRLGEDYDFYVRAMMRGARFVVTDACGYVATVRPGSLSGNHRTEDLRRLAEADGALLRIGGLPESVAAALRRHERHVRDRYRLRRFLDRKAEAGMASALAFAFSSAGNPLPIARGVAADKARALHRRVVPAFALSDQPPVRFLMPPRDTGR
jgi:succinoglycan biosynthesis protein ExoU